MTPEEHREFFRHADCAYELYMRQPEDWKVAHRGKYVLIKEERIVGVYAEHEEAQSQVMAKDAVRYVGGPYTIYKVGSEDPQYPEETLEEGPVDWRSSIITWASDAANTVARGICPAAMLGLSTRSLALALVAVRKHAPEMHTLVRFGGYSQTILYIYKEECVGEVIRALHNPAIRSVLPRDVWAWVHDRLEGRNSFVATSVRARARSEEAAN